MQRDNGDEEDVFVSEVCWNYYVNEMTQAEVAAVMGVTRLRVNQAIQKARAQGIIRIQIESPFLEGLSCAAEVRSAYGVANVLVAPTHPDNYNYHAPAGAALASHLTSRLSQKAFRSIGVSWGMTLEAAARRLVRQTNPELEVVSMLGGTTRGASFNTFGVASAFAEALGAKYSLLAAPIYLAPGLTRDSFLSQAVFEAHFERLRTLDVAILTASDVSARSFLVENGLPRDVTPEDLGAAGAVGDVLGQFLDAEGNDIDHPIHERAVAIDLPTVSRIPEKILAAAGPHKVDIIRAAIRRGLVDTLVTDDRTARLLLEAAR
ncbi:DNA-binding transcriptional regulator LsrR (DeoR family) [Palleronia aestuarii]|uniref:DNA-binding transcriptional regulator LsrR (DeoR family) n=1 Tax=Palleronia aestuarii TaxID=568105 RepID=A0A2W7N1A6_9RHOB|nr:sugar-binding domain-containing protein [Palleronia aestuarii]PZX13761.1 DNA-binding transcriptional regulator LsrR (DeoR family) [Palleronia aestuarii]